VFNEKKRKKYTREFKEEAVKLITDQGYQVAEAARNLGINENMLGDGNERSKEARQRLQVGQGGLPCRQNLTRVKEREVLEK
jgi:transposase